MSKETILVTGSDGFVGSALVRNLKRAGHSVIGIDREEADLVEENSLSPYLTEAIGHVVHLAGRTFVPDSWRAPFPFFQTNLLSTINVLEFCRQKRCGLTYISSYLYGPPDYLPIDEDHPLKSYNPYSQSKFLADHTCRFYATQFGIELTIFRPFNVYGPGQSSNFIIPEIIGKVLDPAMKVLEIKDLAPKRDYLYIDDFVKAIALSIGHPGGVYNIGSGCSVSVAEIVELVFRFTGIVKEIRQTGNDRPGEIYDLYSNNSRIASALSWKPETPFETGLKACIDHHSPTVR